MGMQSYHTRETKRLVYEIKLLNINKRHAERMITKSKLRIQEIDAQIFEKKRMIGHLIPDECKHTERYEQEYGSYVIQ